MKTEQLPFLSQSGIYLISGNKNVSTSVEDFLVITLHSPSSSTTALILKSTVEHQIDFINQMDTIYQKYSSLEDVDPNLIQSKVFGAADKFTSLLATLKGWLNRNHIPVVASDFGRALPGELIVEGASGRIRLQYHSGSWSKLSSILSTGTARNRSNSAPTSHHVLVLSNNPLVRTLARQSIEEEPNWSASCPENLDDSSISKTLKTGHWSAVIVSDELKNQNKLMDRLLEFGEAHPKLPMAWIGAKLPGSKKEGGRFRLLPPLEPFLIPHFKKILKESIQNSNLSETSETLTFLKRKQAKS